MGMFPNSNSPNVTNATGTLSPSNGGTGATSFTDGQLLIGNSTGSTLTPATLTQGSNVTITNGHGTITIAAAGGSSGYYVKDTSDTFSSATTKTINLASSTYRFWHCTISGTMENTGSNGAVTMGLQFNADTGSNYDWAHLQNGIISGFNGPSIAGTDQIALAYTSAPKNTFTYFISFDILFDPATHTTRVSGSNTYRGNGGGGGDVINQVFFSGAYHGAADPTNMTFLTTVNSSGTISLAGANY